MRTFTLLLLVGVVFGVIYMVTAEDDLMGSLDKMFEESLEESGASPSDSGSETKGNEEGKKGEDGKKGGGKKGGGKWGKKGRGMKGFMKAFCKRLEDKKEFFAKLKGKGPGGGKMMDKMNSKCDEVKKGTDTSEGDKDFMKKNFMDRWKGKGSKGGKGGGKADKWEKLREKFQKFSAGKE